MISVLWQSPQLGSSEYCELSGTSGGHRLAGVVVLPVGGRPGHARYRVDVDERWRTREVEVAVVVTGEERRVALSADGEGRWLLGGAPAPDLDGCVDADLGFSPSTNTLPIRRLALRSGEVAPVRAAWVRFPELTVEVNEQSYERLDQGRWRYRSGAFTADLVVEPSSGLVVTYGDGLWATRATGHGPPL